VAERLGRRWLACDSGALAVHLTRKRLLALPATAPFDEYAADPAGEAAPATAAYELTIKPPGEVTLTLDPAEAAQIDYWAVDFEYQDRFCPTWRGFRTRKRPALATSCTHTYAAAGPRTLAVRTLDRQGRGGLR
jgi:hypothetical protein